jgi:PAS domain S-box-containing protein
MKAYFADNRWMLIPALLLVAVFLLLVAGSQSEQKYNAQVMEHLHVIEEEGANISQSALKLRFGLVNNYDELDNALLRQQRSRAALASGKAALTGRGRDIDLAFRELSESLDEYGEQVERFKSSNAQLKNSQHHFPAAVFEFRAKLPENAAGLAINRELSLLFYYVLRSGMDGEVRHTRWIKPLIKNLQASLADQNPELREEALNIVSHAELIMKQRPILDELTSRIIFPRMRQKLENLSSSFQAQAAVRDQRANQYRMVLGALSALLSLSAIALFVRQFRSARQTAREMRLAASVFDNSPFAIAITDEKAGFLRVNPAFTATTGYTEAEVVGKNPRILHSGRQDKLFYENLWLALTTKGQWEGEIYNRRKNGEIYPEQLSIRAIKDKENVVTHYVRIFIDLTQKRAAEDELSAHRNHLEFLVSERTTELIAARNEAERLAQVKGEFLANMSHEIRTPLNAVLGMAQIGSRDSAEPSSQNAFASIQSSGQHLLGVINDILDFSKIDAGKLVIEKHPFALTATLANANSFVAGLIKQKGLTYQLEADPKLPEWVSGDAQRLQQILVNLISNAVKFTAQGQVTLRVARRGEHICFEVIDTGIGMNEEQATRLFKPFEQADSSTTRRFGGTGLGLAISRNLAQLMGGDISVSSTPGTGSTFSLSLPLPTAEPEPLQHAETLAPAGQRLAGLRLLAAEDVAVNRLILEDLLTYEGARITFAENGQEALDRLNEAGVDAFDCVLMDIQMPVMDGFESARRIQEIAPGLPVIGLTAHALAEERDHCLAIGMVEHITKPIDTDLLVAAILRHVSR